MNFNIVRHEVNDEIKVKRIKAF